MNEQQFEKEIVEIKQQLKQINKNTYNSLWNSFFRGSLSGLGSVVGVAVALTIIGWILNVVGVIPAFRNQVTHIEHSLDNLKK